MSVIKTATSALTAVALVSGIGFAWAQTEEQQPAEPTTVATVPSEQTPADPNAVAPADTMPADTLAQQQPPVEDPARTTPPADTTSTPLPSETPAYTPPATTAASEEPAPRADRN